MAIRHTWISGRALERLADRAPCRAGVIYLNPQFDANTPGLESVLVVPSLAVTP